MGVFWKFRIIMSVYVLCIMRRDNFLLVKKTKIQLFLLNLIHEHNASRHT